MASSDYQIRHFPRPRTRHISAMIFVLVFVQTIPQPVVSVDKIEVTASITTPSLGTSVHLSCRIFKPNGFPVEWKRGSVKIANTHSKNDCSQWFVSDRSHYKWSTCDKAEAGLAYQDFNLTIIKTRLEDTGSWMCEEMNDMTKMTIDLKVITLPDIAWVKLTYTDDNVPQLRWPQTAGYPTTFDDYQVIMISPSPGVGLSPSNTIKGDTTDPVVNITGTTPGQQYAHTVAVRTQKGAEYGNPTELTFQAKPTRVKRVIGEHIYDRKVANITWEKVTVGEFTGYRIGVTPSAGVTIKPVFVPASADPPKTFLSDLHPGTVYTLTITTLSGTLESEPFTYKLDIRPLPVTGLIITPNKDKMTVSWTPNVRGTQHKYKVSYRPVFANPASPMKDITVLHPTTKTEVTIIPGEKYEVEVRAISYPNLESFWETARKVTAPLPPTSVTISKSTASSTGMSVSWTAPSPTSYLIKYVILYTKSDTQDTKTLDVSNDVLTTKIESLEAGVSYSVEVFTETKEGVRSESGTKAAREIIPEVDVSSITYAAPIKWPPVINLSWGAVTGPFNTYVITIYPLRGKEKADPPSIPKGGTTTSVLRALVPNTEYTITIRTNDGSQQSEGAAIKLWTVPPPDSLDPLDKSVVSVSGVIGEEPPEDAEEYMEGSFVIDF